MPGAGSPKAGGSARPELGPTPLRRLAGSLQLSAVAGPNRPPKTSLMSGMQVLDVGSAGRSRYLADAYVCPVTGVDLTDEFVEAANAVTKRPALSGAAQGSFLAARFGESTSVAVAFGKAGPPLRRALKKPKTAPVAPPSKWAICETWSSSLTAFTISPPR